VRATSPRHAHTVCTSGLDHHVRWSAATPAATHQHPILENDVSDKSTKGGPSIGLLLLVPAAAIVARAAMRHHQMLWAEAAEPGPAAPHPRHGHHGPAGPGFGATARDFRLPPRIEWMLETWHDRAHQAAEPPETPSAWRRTRWPVPIATGRKLAASGAAVLLGVILQGSALQGIATVPEIVWEAFLGLWLTFRGFRPAIALGEVRPLEAGGGPRVAIASPAR
jgi:hypothetical protein